MSKTFAVIGGDIRQIYLISLLAEKYTVFMYPPFKNLSGENIYACNSMRAAIQDADYIICPIPFTKDNISISCITDGELEIDDFLETINSSKVIIGGNVPSKVTTFCKNNNIKYYDLMSFYDVTVKNSIATAEGAIAEAIKNSPLNLHNHSSLVLGFGNCAKTLASKLKGLDSNVTIAARNPEQLTLAECNGYNTLELNKLISYISEFDFIFNTIPFRVLTSDILTNAKKTVTIIDIASNPGGTDFGKCKNLSLNAQLCLGLPGKYSPKSSSDIIYEQIMKLI